MPLRPLSEKQGHLGQRAPDTELMKRGASTLGQTQLAPQLSPGKAEAGAGVAGSLVPKHLCSMRESQSWQCPCPTGSDVTSRSPVTDFPSCPRQHALDPPQRAHAPSPLPTCHLLVTTQPSCSAAPRPLRPLTLPACPPPQRSSPLHHALQVSYSSFLPLARI